MFYYRNDLVIENLGLRIRLELKMENDESMP